ncbi:hypothetical protein L7F22_056764 [Adiantum nelumboides]|nr:hypothetical protein [Adiantum nelumboides]
MDTLKPLVPAFFIFGDSTVDCGNNNYLITLARADMPPYGRDFANHAPNGRFCNGKISVDYLALYMGLPMVPTALGTPNVTNMMKGLNYASAGAGILPESGSDLGQHISFSEQLGMFSNTEAKMSLSLGQPAVKQAIESSVFYFSIGNNDFIHYYLRNVSGVLEKQNSVEFSSMLLENLSNHLKLLIGGGIKKVVLVGIGPLGCAPNFLSAYNSSSGECISEINSLVQEYNVGLALLTTELRSEFPASEIIFCDIFTGVYDIVTHAKAYGFENTNTACCGAGKYGGWEEEQAQEQPIQVVLVESKDEEDKDKDKDEDDNEEGEDEGKEKDDDNDNDGDGFPRTGSIKC